MPELMQAALDHAEIVEHKELTGELLGEYLKTKQRQEALEKIADMLRNRIIELAKEQRGAIQRGEYTLILKPRKGNVTVDWAGYVEDQIGPLATKELDDLKTLVKDGKAESKWMKRGKDTIVVEVVKGEATPEY